MDGCRYPELPLQRRCIFCDNPTHHLCQIAFEASHALDDCSTPYCPECYVAKKGVIIRHASRVDSREECDSEHENMRTSQLIPTQSYENEPCFDPVVQQSQRTSAPAFPQEAPKVQTQDPTQGHAWYKGSPQEPDLTHATSLDTCRQLCKEWARQAGFNLVQKSADVARGKATFVCACKGRKSQSQANESMQLDQRRARSAQYARGGEEMCPFRYEIRHIYTK